MEGHVPFLWSAWRRNARCFIVSLRGPGGPLVDRYPSSTGVGMYFRRITLKTDAGSIVRPGPAGLGWTDAGCGFHSSASRPRVQARQRPKTLFGCEMTKYIYIRLVAWREHVRCCSTVGKIRSEKSVRNPPDPCGWRVAFAEEMTATALVEFSIETLDKRGTQQICIYIYERTVTRRLNKQKRCCGQKYQISGM